MSIVAKKPVKQIFNQGILTTFGKLDILDIEAIDGRPDQLAALLSKRYDWSSIDAKRKVDLFMTRVLDDSQ
jgi:hypothetical protein